MGFHSREKKFSFVILGQSLFTASMGGLGIHRLGISVFLYCVNGCGILGKMIESYGKQLSLISMAEKRVAGVRCQNIERMVLVCRRVAYYVKSFFRSTSLLESERVQE